MPKSLSTNMYGADETSFASSISSDALSVGAPDADFWGDLQDSRAIAKANTGAESTGPSDPDTPILPRFKGGNLENEKLMMPPLRSGSGRHIRGPSTSSDEGAGKKFPPPSNQTSRTGKQKSPAYTNETA